MAWQIESSTVIVWNNTIFGEPNREMADALAAVVFNKPYMEGNDFREPEYFNRSEEEKGMITPIASLS